MLFRSDRLQTDLQTVGTTFLRRSEAEEVLNRLYSYAYARGVRVVNLQAQNDASAATTPAPPYETLLYQVQVAGAVSNLIDFIAHFKEASLPAVNIVSMSALGGADQTTLTMMLQFYTSQYASGQILSVYPTPDPILPSPTPTEMPTLAVVPPTEAPPTATYTPSPVLPSPTPTNTVTATLAPTATLAADSGAATEDVVVCPGAPPTLFKPGDFAIVDFNDLGALRVLSDPNAPVTSTRTQAYDNHRLEIITGPVCANATYYWYVRNLSQDDALGWVAEGRGEDRWLCPEANPECVP